MNPWKKNPVIYEINTRVWVQELTAQMGYPVTLKNVPSGHWDALQQLKVDAVWLMGVWERSARGIAISNQHPGNLADFRRALPDFTFADNVGSPYCIKRYVVDSAFGGNQGLAGARAELARRGIKLILDFVPNHLAHDHPWVEETPDYFISGSREDLLDDPVTFVNISGGIFACGRDPFYPAWQDVLQVNAFYPALREAMIETVSIIAGQCDGVRCDMAMLMINSVFRDTWGNRAGPEPILEYWEELIPAVKRRNRDFMFIAEAYWDKEWELQQQGFDFCYDKRLYDRLERGSATEILQHLTADTGYQSKLLRFVENHDEQRHTAAFPAGRNLASAMVFSTLPGAKLFHEGQFEGRRVKLPVFLRRRPDEMPDPGLQDFYKRLLHAIALPVFHSGAWQLCECRGWTDNQSFENLLAWIWQDETERYLVVVNYSPAAVQGRVMIPGNDLRGSEWLLQDLFCDTTYERNGEEMHDNGLYVGLPPWNYHVLRVNLR